MLDATVRDRSHDFLGCGADDLEDFASIDLLTTDKHLVVLSVGCHHVLQLLSNLMS